MTVLYDDIVVGAKSRAIFVTNQNTLTDTNIYQFLNDIVRLDVTSQIDRTAQEFFVIKNFIPLVSGVSNYQIPYRSMGRQLREIQWYDSTQNQYRQMPMIKLEDANLYGTFGSSSYCYGYYLQGDQIVLVPPNPQNVPNSYFLACWYKMIPSQPVEADTACKVTGVDPLTGIVTCTQVPSTYTPGVLIDFIRGYAGCSLITFDVPVLSATTTSLTFDITTLPSELAIGDWISLAQTSPVLNMIPDEASSLIQCKLAQVILNAIGDEVGAKALNGLIAMQQDSLLRMVSPRVDGEPQIIISRNNLTRGGRNWQNSSYRVGPGG